MKKLITILSLLFVVGLSAQTPTLPITKLNNLSITNPVQGSGSDKVMVRKDSDGILRTVTQTSITGLVNAKDYGFSPTNTSSQNVIAMQNACEGGNKKVIVTIPGDYGMNGEVLMDSNTEIEFYEGVFINKTANVGTLFINRGAYTRTYNENITLRGLTVKTNGFEGQYDTTSPIYGVRGIVNFYYAKNIKIYDSECLDIGTVNWFFSFNRYEDVLVDNIKVAGNKDAMNWGNGKRCIIRNVWSSCYDDTLGINPFGYPQSSPEVGSIIDMFVENVYYKHNPAWPDGGRMFNFQMGTVSDWYSGKMILTGDIVNAGGNTYIAIGTPAAGVEVSSVTEPTIEVFDSVQTTPENISWRIQKLNETTGRAQVENITFKNIKHDSNEMGVILTYFAGNDGTDSRTVHPDVSPLDYPEAKNIKFDGLETKYGYFYLKSKLGHNTEITGLQGHLADLYVILSDDTVKPSVWNIHDCNLGAVNTGFAIGNNGDVIINNNIQDGVLNFGGLTAGRLQGNTNVDIDPATLDNAQLGDIIRVNNVVKKYNGTAFVNNATLDEVTDVGNTTTNDVTFGKVTFGNGSFISNIFSAYVDASLGSVFIAKNGTTYEYFFANSEGNPIFFVPINTVDPQFQGNLTAVGGISAGTSINGAVVTATGNISAGGTLTGADIATGTQVTIGSTAPTLDQHGTRKDYVDPVNNVNGTGVLALAATNKQMYYTFTGTTTTWTLPVVSGNTLLRYTLINAGSGNITLNSNSGANDILDAGTAVNTKTIASGSVVTLYNNGTNFVIITQ